MLMDAETYFLPISNISKLCNLMQKVCGGHTPCFFSFAKPGKDECCFYGETMVATIIM